MAVDAPKRILIVKLSAIGDVLMATPVSRALRAAFPDSYIAWAVERKSADIVIGNPYLDEVIVWERTKRVGMMSNAVHFVKSFGQLRRELRARQFDVCVDLQGLIRSAGVCVASGSKRRVGFSDGEEFSTRFYHETYDPGKGELNAEQRNLDLLKVLGVESTDTAMYMPVPEEDKAFADTFFNDFGLNKGNVVAFCPATTWANKHWVAQRWSKVADLLSEKYNARCVILGSKADIALATTIVDGSRSKPVIAAGQTTLKQAGAVMLKSEAVIGVDTGLLHMAVALDRPAVGLFGASAWRCFLRKDNFIWVAKEFPCSPCLRHPTCNDVACMKAITPDDVGNAVKRFLE